jgi:ABC-type polysaccharide/polyol phosphate transport system ATPase subunit
MSNIAIKIENLSKVYKLYDQPLDRLKESLHPLRRKYHHDFFALDNVSFEIKKGETVGIIGKNGSGKSTILKIIAGVLTPTAGKVTIDGRISALLELGTGFNPEFTGLENIYFSGTIMGYTKEQMEKKVDDILAFADIGEYINQPVKSYSSGMFVRLAFAVAVNINPEILIIDEALSVGDAAFQRKSFNKIEEFREDGRTILLVSHDLNTISSFCSHAIFLDAGKVVEQGEPQHITKIYYETLFCQPENSEEMDIRKEIPDDNTLPSSMTFKKQESKNIKTLRMAALQKLGLREAFNQKNPRTMRMGNKKAEILDFGINDMLGKRTTLLTPGSNYTFFLHALFHEDVDSAVIGFQIRNVKGVDMYGTSTLMHNINIEPHRRGDIIETNLNVTMWLTNGIYFLTLGISDPQSDKNTQFDLHYDAYQFEVKRKDNIYTTSIVDLDASITYNTLFNLSNTPISFLKKIE